VYNVVSHGRWLEPSLEQGIMQSNDVDGGHALGSQQDYLIQLDHHHFRLHVSAKPDNIHNVHSRSQEIATSFFYFISKYVLLTPMISSYIIL
jgi:hypothetical protein